MVARLSVIVLCLGILSTVTGCAGDPSPYEFYPYGNRALYGVYGQPETSQEQNYERQIDKEVEQYRQRRRVQEQAQEQAHQQWEQERARERDPRWEWQR
jgi:hypothetical protein